MSQRMPLDYLIGIGVVIPEWQSKSDDRTTVYRVSAVIREFEMPGRVQRYRLPETAVMRLCTSFNGINQWTHIRDPGGDVLMDAWPTVLSTADPKNRIPVHQDYPGWTTEPVNDELPKRMIDPA